MTALLNKNKEEYHTYFLQEDRLQRAVIRGIPVGVTEEAVKKDLEAQGIRPISVQRMSSRKTKEALPLLLIQVSQDDRSMLQVTRCCGLLVRTEKQRTQQTASQCHRCQRFGHGQSRCTARPKCVKCAGEHPTTECKKSREEPARCANCDGDHPASYRGCPKFPKQTRKPAPAPKTQGKDAEQATRPKPRSFAEAAKSGKTTVRTAPATAQEHVNDQLAAIAMSMQQMMLAMGKIMDTISERAAARQ